MGLAFSHPRSAPDTNVLSEHGEAFGIQFAVSAIQGYRPTMEDHHCFSAPFPGPGTDALALFGVFDGHCNDIVSHVASLELPHCLADLLYHHHIDNQQPSPPSPSSGALPQRTSPRSPSPSMSTPTAPPPSVTLEGSVAPVRFGPHGWVQRAQECMLVVDELARDALAAHRASPHATAHDYHSPHRRHSAFAAQAEDAVTPAAFNAGFHRTKSTHLVAPVAILPSTTAASSSGSPAARSPAARSPAARSPAALSPAAGSPAGRGRQKLGTGPVPLGGSTALWVLVSSDEIMLVNCGDSRAVVGNANGSLRFATVDHTPVAPGETARIEAAGHFVSDNRVDGQLAPSRCLGDFQFKDIGVAPAHQAVTAHPEVTVLARRRSDLFVLLACDGIWDVMDNAAVVTFVTHRLTAHQSPSDICTALIFHCLERGSTDNLTALLVVLPTRSATPTPTHVSSHVI